MSNPVEPIADPVEETSETKSPPAPADVHSADPDVVTAVLRDATLKGPEAAAAAATDIMEHPQNPQVVTATHGTDDTAEQTTVSPSPSKGKEKESSVVPPPLKESESSMAIGPAQDEIKAATPGAPDSGPVCSITLLLTSGSRHPYRLDGKYLSRRGVKIPEQTEAGLPDPFSISIYTLKELILREWRNDWEAAPSSPSSIRLIHFGKLLEDKEPLRKYQFSADAPNVVHMSIRPQDLDEEEPKSGAKNPSTGDGSRRSGGMCCMVL